jgi:hypothetical protein
VAQEPLDLVGVDVGSGHLDGGGQVEDDLPLRAGLPHVHHPLADLHRIVELGAGEALRRVLEAHVALRDTRGQLLAEDGPAHRDVDDAGPVEPEHHPALQGGGGVVEVHEGPRGAAQRLERALDLLGPGLGQHLDHHVVRDQVLLDQLPDEVEVGLGGGREADLDLLEAAAHQQVEHPALSRRVHRIDQGLVAVPQVHAAPARSLADDPRRPRPVRQRDRSERAVVVKRHLGWCTRRSSHERPPVGGNKKASPRRPKRLWARAAEARAYVSSRFSCPIPTPYMWRALCRRGDHLSRLSARSGRMRA